MKRLLVAIALAGVSHVTSAQGIPALGAAKRAANNAVNATNASISEQTGQALPKPRGSTVNTGTQPAATTSTPTAPANSASKGVATVAAKDSAKAGAKPASAPETFSREVYSYDAAGRRDPFLSLLASGDLRPSFSDLKLVAVAYDPTGRKSVAVMRDISTRDQYRVKVGQTLGRMRVAQIHPKSVTFVIDEFGYSRQEILALGDSTTRNP